MLFENEIPINSGDFDFCIIDLISFSFNAPSNSNSDLLNKPFSEIRRPRLFLASAKALKSGFSLFENISILF